MTRLLFALALALFAIPAAQAENLDDPIAGHPGKTWYDLIRAVVPDLSPSGEGSKTIPLRYVEDLGDSDEDPVPEGPFVVHDAETRTIRAEGRQLTVLSVDIGPAEGWAASIEALALFDEEFKLLDAINVGQDRFNELRADAIPISARDEALLTYSEHFNSNQTYGSYALVMVRDGRWQTIDTVSTLSDRWCGHERTQSLDVASTKTGAGYWPITVTVTDIQRAQDTDGECGDEADETDFEKGYAATYNWSASMGLYVADGDSLTALADENSGRY
jgi:hypothetical protein